jgi:hypothetical protein
VTRESRRENGPELPSLRDHQKLTGNENVEKQMQNAHMPIFVVWAHGSMSRTLQIPTNGSRVIFPNLANWPVDVIASNLIKELLVTAETAQDLRSACHRLEKFQSTEIVDHIVFGDEETQPKNVLLQHRLTPSEILPDFCIYQPLDLEPEYFEFLLEHDGIAFGNTRLFIQLNIKKLLDQVASADGTDSPLSDNSAVLLFLKPNLNHLTSIFLSDVINKILPNLTISVARPKVRNASNREKIEVILVHVKSEFNSHFADNDLRQSLERLHHGDDSKRPAAAAPARALTKPKDRRDRSLSESRANEFHPACEWA